MFLKDRYIALYLLLIFVFSSCKQEENPYFFNITRERIQIPMRDSVKLGAILYKPQQEGTYPAMVYRSPYNIENYDSYAELPIKAVRRGYIVVLVDVRGRYSSEGEFKAYHNEKQDGYDVIEWVAKIPGCNGQVVTYGGSYPGIIQWLALAEDPPGLKAAAPEMTPINSHHFFYYGGAFSHAWLDWFMPYILADKRKRAGDEAGPWDSDVAEEEWNVSDKRKWYDFRPLDKLPLFGYYAPEYFEWLNHSAHDEWWDFAEVESYFPEFDQPVYLLSGWYDAAYGPKGAIEGFRKIHEMSSARSAKYTRLILGPWNHTTVTVRKNQFGNLYFGPSAGLDYDKELLDWYDLVLGKSEDPDPLPVVSYFMMGANEWRSDSFWPPQGSQPVLMYLNSSTDTSSLRGSLIWDEPSVQNLSMSYIFDPENPLWDIHYLKSVPFDQTIYNDRRDVLIFDSETIQEDLEIAGEVRVELFVGSDARDTDFSFTLCDVYPDGRAINLAGLDNAYLRMRYRNGTESEELLEPGEIYPIQFGSFYTANRFLPGHKIRLMITSSKAPHYTVNHNTGNPIPTDTVFQKATNSIYLGGEYLSRVLLPVIK